MRRTIGVSLVVCAALSAGFFAGSWHSQTETLRAAGLHGRRILYYVDPMHPAYKSDRPGAAPDCGMALEPIYADGGGDQKDARPVSTPPNAIEVTAEKQQLIGVRVGTVVRASGIEHLHAFGRVAADETRVYKVNIGVDGYMREVSPATTGSQVRKDEWLATFSSSEMKQPIQSFIVTLDVLDREVKNDRDTAVQVAFARQSVEQSIDRLLTMGMSPVQIDEIRRTKVVPPTIRMTAPGDGFIIARRVSLGEKLEKGTELYRIADLRRVWVLADVPVGDADRVHAGMAADIALPGRNVRLRGRISGSVLPQFEPTTQSTRIRLEVDNAGFLLRPDMFVDVDLLAPYGAATLVPASAIIASGLHNTVFVERRAGAFEPRDVTVGRRVNDFVEVVDGLEPGERIVVSGTFLLDSESRMRGHD